MSSFNQAPNACLFDIILDLEEDGADEDDLDHSFEQETGYRPYPNKLVCNDSVIISCIQGLNNIILDDVARHY